MITIILRPDNTVADRSRICQQLKSILVAPRPPRTHFASMLTGCSESAAALKAAGNSSSRPKSAANHAHVCLSSTCYYNHHRLVGTSELWPL